MQLLTKVNAIVLLGIYSVSGLLYGDVAINELNCENSYDQCRQYQDSRHNILATCVNGRCFCTQHKVTIKCVLPDWDKYKSENNTIAGPCPCPMRYSVCKDDICYCEKGKWPSKDKRECLPDTVILNQPCEYDKQCQSGDVFSLCNGNAGASKKVCNCREGFIDYGGKCLSTIRDPTKVKTKTNCLISPQCQRFGLSFCHKMLQLCICQSSVVGSDTSQTCLYPASYGQICNDNVQCQYEMGMGATCHKKDKVVNGTCLCKHPYVEKPLETTETKHRSTKMLCDWRTDNVSAIWKYDEYKENVTNILCILPPGVGDYCNGDDLCKHPGLTHESESLHCINATCKCREGHVYKLNHHCVIKSGSTLHGPQLGYMYFGIAIRILKSLYCCDSV